MTTTILLIQFYGICRHTSTQDLFPLNDLQGQIKSQRDSFPNSGTLCGFQNNFNTSALHLRSSFDPDNQNRSFGQTIERSNSRNFLNSPLKLNDLNSSQNFTFRVDEEDSNVDDCEENIDVGVWDVEEVKNWLISCNMNDLIGTCMLDYCTYAHTFYVTASFFWVRI